MNGEDGFLENMLSAIGITVAAAAIMVVALLLLRSTMPADAVVAEQSAAAGICGDIGTAAVSVVPYVHCVRYDMPGINVNITEDYVVASDGNGQTFAKPLAVRVYPGSYHGQDGVGWNNTSEMRSLFGADFAAAGTGDAPFSPGNGSRAARLLEAARRSLALRPLALDADRPLAIEKLFLYTYDSTNHSTERDPYVFVYQG